MNFSWNQLHQLENIISNSATNLDLGNISCDRCISPQLHYVVICQCSKKVCCRVASLFPITSIFHRQMTALTGNCIKVLGHGPLRVNAKSKNMITCKTSKLTSDTKIFHIYSAIFLKSQNCAFWPFINYNRLEV